MTQDDGSRTLILISHKVLLGVTKTVINFTSHFVLVRVLLILFESSGHMWCTSLVIPEEFLFDITIN